MKIEGSRFVLFVPVYRGGNMFQRCLRSLERSQHLFDLIVISLNGDEVAEDLASVASSNLEECRVKVLTTRRLLPPARHLAWATRAIKPYLQLTDHVLLLAHDDELDAHGLDHWVRTRSSDWHLRAWIGDYLYIDDRDPDVAPLGLQAIPDSTPLPLRLSGWLAVNATDPRQYVDTNMSGISVPFSTLLRTSRFITTTRMTNGSRFEYILVSSRSNVAIDRRSPPVGIIHLHPDQAGRSVPPAKREMDEARYCLWLILNAKTLDELKVILMSPWGLRRLLRAFKGALSKSFQSRWHHIAAVVSARSSGAGSSRSKDVK
jgi:hypothetical protein